jgi:hypothetical protein
MSAYLMPIKLYEIPIEIGLKSYSEIDFCTRGTFAIIIEPLDNFQDSGSRGSLLK